ncbi:MAG: Mannose-1-phosphate guanylyltransferase [uncultured bacterium]|nr:MAG: Mannose-1-phosphate guanylyltransferase [uncultured bacterium]HCU70699.1 mannose-1-phosphate guanylyltransferase [Candidatus Moranbacteria bacterium]
MIKKKKNFYAVIMAGGTGTRLWPLSRKQKPKQFQSFTSNKTMIQETYARVAKVVPKDNIFISTTDAYIDLALQQLPQLKKEQLILEPMPRGTAPAIALVAKYISKINPDAIVATVASDHVIKNVEEFCDSLFAALCAAEKNVKKLVIVGINPTCPDTGLGYIKMGKELDNVCGKKVFLADAFVEKPDKKTAEKYLAKWEYLWNAGYFIFSATDFLEIVKKFTPKTSEVLNEIEKEWNKKTINKKKIEKLYISLENEPIDTAIAEKLDKNDRLVVPSEMQWSDVGNWGSLFDFLNGDAKTSIVVRGKHIDVGSKDCFIHAENKLVATLGLKDIVIIESEDAILVADKNSSGEVKKIIEKLKEGGQNYL